MIMDANVKKKTRAAREKQMAEDLAKLRNVAKRHLFLNILTAYFCLSTILKFLYEKKSWIAFIPLIIVFIISVYGSTTSFFVARGCEQQNKKYIRAGKVYIYIYIAILIPVTSAILKMILNHKKDDVIDGIVAFVILSYIAFAVGKGLFDDLAIFSIGYHALMENQEKLKAEEKEVTNV